MLELPPRMQVQMIGQDGNFSMGKITFYTRAIGSSHIASGKPCQDNGRHYNKNGVSIAIVCDGHGSDSYVRSEIGSELAAQIAEQKILDFIYSTPKELFLGKKGAVTVIPKLNPMYDKLGRKKNPSLLSENEIELIKQNNSYIESVKANPELEDAVRNLFKEITEEWYIEIKKDFTTHPFTNSEKDKLGNRSLQKAYGTTLIAAVTTPDYWFAFQIGDGKLYYCNDLMEWVEPIPWDVNCFLNITTSLCDPDPVDEFRYAFDGTGNSPLAFTLGSDGIDDTFIKTNLIHKFYCELLCVFNEKDQKEAEILLERHLAKCSEIGSHDDMSVAAIIDKGRLKNAVEYYQIISEQRKLNLERDQKQNDIKSIRNNIEELKQKIENKSSQLREKEESLWGWWRKMWSEMWDKRKENQTLFKQIKQLEIEIQSKKKVLEEAQRSFDDWITEKRKIVSKLKEEATEIKQKIMSEKSYSLTDTFVLGQASPNGFLHNSKTETADNNRFISDSSDNPEIYKRKAVSARPSEDDISQMDQDSESQFKEISSNNTK